LGEKKGTPTPVGAENTSPANIECICRHLRIKSAPQPERKTDRTAAMARRERIRYTPA
jgi:hypothetical protein